MKNRKDLLLAVLLSVLIAHQAQVRADSKDSERSVSMADLLTEQMLTTQSFLNGHPDLRWRTRGIEAWKEGQRGTAYNYFRRASRYADKPSQAMVAEMLWSGAGVGRNRSEAYVWMDMAAERGHARFLAWREDYWQQLGEEERAHALEIGPALYQEFGDESARKRHRMVMSRMFRSQTGSRAGYTGNTTVLLFEGRGFMGGTRPGRGVTPADAESSMSVDGTLFYHPTLWVPEKYWAWREEIADGLPHGIVEVLPIRGEVD